MKTKGKKVEHKQKAALEAWKRKNPQEVRRYAGQHVVVYLGDLIEPGVIMSADDSPSLVARFIMLRKSIRGQCQLDWFPDVVREAGPDGETAIVWSRPGPPTPASLDPVADTDPPKETIMGLAKRLEKRTTDILMRILQLENRPPNVHIHSTLDEEIVKAVENQVRMENAMRTDVNSKPKWNKHSDPQPPFMPDVDLNKIRYD